MEPLRKPSDCDDWIRELEGPLTRYAASLGLNPHDAQDAVQDGLIALVRAVSKNPEAIKRLSLRRCCCHTRFSNLR